MGGGTRVAFSRAASRFASLPRCRSSATFCCKRALVRRRADQAKPKARAAIRRAKASIASGYCRTKVESSYCYQSRKFLKEGLSLNPGVMLAQSGWGRAWLDCPSRGDGVGSVQQSAQALLIGIPCGGLSCYGRVLLTVKLQSGGLGNQRKSAFLVQSNDAHRGGAGRSKKPCIQVLSPPAL